jgi:hypothetical protein
VSVVRMQVGRVVAAAVVVGAVVSGCGGPSQAGTAVFIGEDAVPLERVQTQLDTALSKGDLIAQITAQGGSTADLARSIVTRAVMHDLLALRAAEEGIAVTDAEVDAFITENGGADALLDGSLFDLPMLRERVRDDLIAAQLAQREVAGLAVTDAEVDAFITENGGADALLDGSLFDLPMLRERVRDDLIAAQLAQREVAGLAVTADLVAATSRADAEAKAATLRAGGAEAEALFGDPRTSARDTTFDAASSPDNASSVLFGVPAGTVVTFQPSPEQSTWIVARVVDRRTDAPSDPAVVSSISRAQLVAIGERMLQPTADQVGIRVNPRYGVWDPVQLRIVAEDQRGGTVLPPVAS